MYMLVGLESTGYGCGVDSIPGLYARVSELREFVDGFSVGSKWQLSAASETPSSSIPPLTTNISNSTTTNSNGLPSPSTEAPQRRDGYTQAPAQTSTPPLPLAAEKETSTTPLLVSELRLDSLAPWLRDALLAFLVGDGDAPFLEGSVTSEMISRLMIASHDIRLYLCWLQGRLQSELHYRP
ncbi:hypothetical protein PINS_up022111 [Pythium insidiosum]|nr:hypothetical protein PINS_up022111 [Pythium insidiosum]